MPSETEKERTKIDSSEESVAQIIPNASDDEISRGIDFIVKTDASRKNTRTLQSSCMLTPTILLSQSSTSTAATMMSTSVCGFRFSLDARIPRHQFLRLRPAMGFSDLFVRKAILDVSKFTFILDDHNHDITLHNKHNATDDTGDTLRHVIDKLSSRLGSAVMSSSHFILVSSDYHLIRIQEIYRLSPR